MAQTSEALSALFPSASQTDDESVTSCLETARALWEKGDVRESIRWLQRGATAAEEAGDDGRALVIARSAADLVAELGPLSSRPPSTESTSSESRSGGPESRQRATEAASAQSSPSPSVRRSAPPVPSRTHSSAPPAASPSVAPGSQASGASLLPSQNELIAQGRALRVAVKRSAIDGALYVVRPLAGRPGAGAREALLVLAEPDPAFFSDPVKS